MIIGVQKGGTSSLHHYLIQHPRLIAPKTKELHYFDTQAATPSDEYNKQFPRVFFNNKISFEATPRYIYYPGTAKKIFDYDPNMKFIVLLRDPVKRAYSAWNMYRDMRNNSKLLGQFKKREEMNPLERTYSFFYEGNFPSFEEWIETETGVDFPSDIIEPSIVKRGYYKEQIETYLHFFPKSSFLFLDFDDFQKQTLHNLEKVAYFLGISSFNKLNLDLKTINKRTYPSTLDDETYQNLVRHFQIKNKGLDVLVDINLSWMNC
jgi:hypothetical protein